MTVLANKQVFWGLLILVLGIKIFVAYTIPMTGDEAYFILWAKHPDYGYYDHTPMVGWFLSALLYVSDAKVWLRLPAILLFFGIGLGIYFLLRKGEREIARLATLLFLFTPVSLIGVLITTDIPLVLWSFVSGIFFYLAQRDGRMSWYFLCGLFLGLAFLAKFFAGLMAVTFLVFVLLHRRQWRTSIPGLFWIGLGLLPAVVLNLYWNYEHCWNNYLFNLLNRTRGSQLSLKHVLTYLLTLVYLVTPPLLWYIWRSRRVVFTRLRDPVAGVYLGLFFIPITLFLLLSLVKSIGLHWLLSFYPFLILGLGEVLNRLALRNSLMFMIPFGLLHVVIVAVFTLAPGLLSGIGESYKSVVIGTQPEKLLAAAAPYSNSVLATDSYAFSATLGYHAREHVSVFGKGSYHGRQDDLITDFRGLAGRDFVIIAENPTDYQFAWYFDDYVHRPLDIDGVRFYIGIGRGFRYERYRQEILSDVMAKYYAIPDFLPHAECYMSQRYGQPAR
jgi:4-amino-4-deoxy-L-arabinose transferase-like glycosyltransferase